MADDLLLVILTVRSLVSSCESPSFFGPIVDWSVYAMAAYRAAATLAALLN